MRLSEWRASSPNKDAASAKIAAIVDPILLAFGAGTDPVCWVAWGEDPAVRFAIYAPTPAGLITCYVRLNVAGEGPRASAKLNRWNRVQVGELAMETQGAHRLLSFQVEGQVLNGADDRADQVAAFALELFAAIDGRPAPIPQVAARRDGSAKPAAGAKGRATGTKALATVTKARTTTARASGGRPAGGKRPAGSSR
jgi:hypothetical protein